MRKFLTPLVVLLFVTGCPTIPEADSPTKMVAIAKVLYASALDAVTAGYRNGHINARTLVTEVEPVRLAVRAAIDKADRLIELDDPDAFKYAEEALDLAKKFKDAYSQYGESI